jgi:hypothetical protein
MLAVSGCAGLAMLHAAACIPDLPDWDEVAGAGDAADDVSTTDAGPVDEVSAPDVAVVPHCGDGIIELAQMEQCDPGKALGDAGTAFCSAQCKVRCPDGGFLWSFNDHCYTLAGEATSLGDAGALCAPGGHVVTFASDEEFMAVTTALGPPDDGGDYWFWVGMRARVLGDNHYASVVMPYEPGWSPECKGCYARPNGDAGDFARNDAGIGGDCVRSLASPSAASWEKYACIDAPKLPVICEHEPDELSLTSVGTQRGAYFRFGLVSTFPSKTYVYDPMPTPEGSAAITCASHNGTLVTLQSRDEREQLWRALEKTSATQVWIGLAASDGGWAWEGDASRANPPEWAIGEPVDSGTRRAYLELTNMRPVDTTLAHTGSPGLPLPGVVCETH